MRSLPLLVISLALAACGGANVSADTATARADTYTLAATYDPGMSHVAITAVLMHEGRVVRALVLGRFLNACAADRYVPLAREPPPEGTLLAIGCDAMPTLSESSTPVLVRVVARGGLLVGEWANVVDGRPATFTVAGSFPLPEGAIVRADTAGAESRDDLDESVVVRTCHAYPDSCD